MPAEWAKISPSPLSWAPRIRPPIPDLQNTPDLSSFVTVFLRLTQPGLSLVKGMLLADEANNDIGFFVIKFNGCAEETVVGRAAKPTWFEVSRFPARIRSYITNRLVLRARHRP